MSKRITEKELQSLVDRLNRIAGVPLEPYSKNKREQWNANIGNYHLDYSYGGVNLLRMISIGGSCEKPLATGWTTKRELYQNIHSYLNGMDAAENMKGKK